MDISSYSAQLLKRESFLSGIPNETLDILRHGSNQDYRDQLANLALDPRYTSTIFTTHEGFFVEICSNWLTKVRADSAIDPVTVVLALTRILPLAPHLAVYAKELLFRQRPGILHIFSSRSAMALVELPESCLSPLLLALFRLLRFDNEEFAVLISPAQLQLLLSHSQHSVRYLAIRILCLYLHASDAAMEKMIENYCSQEQILGSWEHLNIDYAFLTLWEEKITGVLARELQSNRSNNKVTDGVLAYQREILQDSLSDPTACLGKVLVPMLNKRSSKVSSLIMTKTLIQNTSNFAHAINEQRPVLLTGFPGCGKTSLVKKVAEELGQDQAMITLHLNEQTDAKLLIGMYVSAGTPGSFKWQPGVLTKAVLEGRWVIIEDLDRAPTEILSTILPLLERRELLVPHWGETIRPTSNFKLIATIRTKPNLQGEEAFPGSNMLGIHHWRRVPLLMPGNEELVEIVECKYPILRAYIQKIIRVYSSINSMLSDMRAKLISQRQVGPRNLYRWCSRLQDLLSTAGVRTGNEPISEILNDMILLEAVDCFAGHLPDGPTKSYIVEVISQELHVPAARAKHCLEVRKPEYVVGDATLRIGRTCISKKTASQAANSTSLRSWKIPFATTSQVLRNMESVTIAVKMAEPCLLVGETGTGKTTLIQQLADLLGCKLNVVNLSQQSEASDLLGGFKPLSIRALAVPMQEEFDALFESTFSSKRNQKYVQTIGKAISKGRWLRVLTLWQEALKLVRDNFEPNYSAIDHSEAEPRQKKRKLETPRNLKLKRRWDGFASSVQTFQMHLASDSKGFAFAFVEGQIVQAAKNGDWILLDEINLASQDTLESLADLISNGIDGVPTLLLSEMGNTERIQAHKDFRIFGAMNPATDVGKRDLPSSIRSRFTEIYLDHPDRDYDNLVLIVKAYFGNHNNLDLRAASDIAHLYLEIQKLAEENRLVDGANQKAHFSLRTLTRTLIYVTDIISIYGLRRALYEGFSMSFLTLLNKESELLLLPLIHKYILGSSKNAGSFIQQVPRAPQNITSYVQFRHYWMARGAAPICQQPLYIITPFVERNLLNLVRATSTRRFPVLLQGPTSSGKTSMIEYLARISGNQCMRINNHEHTDLQEYLGSYVSGPDGRLQYQEGILVRALREGHWIILDELNLAPTDVLEALNRLLDDNKELLVPEIQQVIKPHKNFMLFATQNPPGMYGGRKMLSRAFRNRFLELHFDDIPEDELETILRERSKIAPSFCAKIVAVYKKLSIFRQRDRLFDQKNSFATLRDLFRWALRNADDREQLAINGFWLLAERVRNPDESLVVKKIIEDVMKIKISVAQIYEADSSFMPSISSLTCSQEIVWTKSMRRLYILVSQALKRNEPVLLVGETGSGKTTICQVIAAEMKQRLHIVNAHQNMETGDLIGAQRPVRNRAAISGQLVQDLTRIMKSHMKYEGVLADDLSSLLTAYDAFVLERPSALSHQERAHIEQNRTHLAAMFEWSDGSLVHAMRNGQYFLLDEISLADDSVLERLNSVLESDRTLLLAEQGSTNNLIVASDGFQFLATMNPGGDFGKRELSPALRNRFTEIWVPPATDCEEMFQIAEAKLSPSFLKYSSPMISFAEWYGTTYSPMTPNISIRDLLAWIQFVNSYSGSSPHEALLHGAAMVYIDGLGANPAARVWVSEADVHQQRQECLMKLSLLLQHDMESIYKRKIDILLTDHKLCFGSFCLETVTQTTENLGYHLETPTTKANAMKIVRALQLRKPVLLEGNPGVGKSTIVIALAGLAGVPLTRINLSEQTDLMDLFGSDVPIDGAHAGNFGWRDAPFLRAMQKGEWVLLDEMNLASQTVLEGLNSCFDHRGQVYISELDQTFTRHPRFTVFAAQNPHQQGGGRKGLPVSFVNRFTTVYTDAFTAPDLLTICSQCYPQHAAQSIESLVRCVTDLTYVLHNNNEIAAHGGPWEINLRDLFRWLSLLNSDDLITSAGNAVDYQDLLVMQRFRNIGSVTAVKKVLEKYLPQAGRTPSFVHSMTSNYIQVGFAFVERDPLIKPLIDRRIQQVSVNLRLVESALLCIKKNWPCLLVGPSGSGKTSLILQLANYIGTEIVNLPLNADMDTMDLIGGYEQLDVQRERVSLLKQLSQTTRSLIADHFASTSDMGLEILVLEEKLRAELPDMVEIVELCRRLGNHYPNLCYSSVAAECEKISRQSSEDNRARFEWVDGLLVKALKQGQWLVLDNANLCSSSILDRLNALLEPNGFLSVNEHRTPDGHADIVKPHRNFRLFLTINPQYGELSRAMRNRCIEIYLPAEGLGSLKPLGTAYEPSISKFQVFETIDWTAPNRGHIGELSSVCSDFLSFSDYAKCRRWEGELAKGLLKIPHEVQALLISELDVRHSILQSKGNTIHRIQAIYEELAKKARLAPDFGTNQSLHPLNNPVLVAFNAHYGGSFDLALLSEAMELLVETCCLEARLRHLSHQLNSKALSQMTRLERSLVPDQTARTDRLGTNQVGSFLKNMTQFVRSVIDDIEYESPKELQSVVHFVGYVSPYLRDIFDLTNSPEFDDGAFQTYLTIGRSITKRVVDNSAIRSISENLNSELNAFKDSWQLHTGLSMGLLWRLFKPSLAKNLGQLESRAEAKELAHRFDTIKWMTGATIRDLDLLRSSIINLHDTIDSAEDEVGERFKDIQIALKDLESRSPWTELPEKPHFSAQFEGLCQHEALTRVGGMPAFLELLAGRPANFSTDMEDIASPWTLLAHIDKVTGISRNCNSLAVVRNTLHVSLLGKLVRIPEIPLGKLSLLREEMNILTENIRILSCTGSCDQLDILNSLLAKIIGEVCQAHRDVLDPLSLSSCLAYIKKFNERSSMHTFVLEYPVLCLVPHVPESHYFSDIIRNHLNPALRSLHESLKPGPQKLMNAATAWINVFICCLRIYVPDKPFDPALKPFVERTRHHKRETELEAKLKALQDFQMIVTGQSTSLRSQIVQHKLQNLGEEPQVIDVPRPRVSELVRLCGEFKNLLESIVFRCPDGSALRSFFAGDTAPLQEFELLRSNISRFRPRISATFAAYEDITKPLVAMLNGLDVGLGMAFLARSVNDVSGLGIRQVSASTPFLGMQIRYYSEACLNERESLPINDLDSQISFLKNMALYRSVDPKLAQHSSRMMCEAFHSIYQDWRKIVEKDKQHNATMSSIYRYRGAEADAMKTDESDFLDCFPDFTETRAQFDDVEKSRSNQRSLAQQLAGCHEAIFRHEKSTTNLILTILEEAAEKIGKLWLPESDAPTCEIPTEETVCAVALGLSNHQNRLNRIPTDSKSYNFYVDANLVEVKKLLLIVQRVQIRFSYLAEAWPEHATIKNVLQTSSELMALRHAEPIAKILTKTEQLHGFVHEWQAVASKEYSAINLYDQITNLLIDWRRLELSTWARLLDIEDKKCDDDVESWWFVAYEVIIAVPLSIINSGENIQLYAEQLLATLGEFLATTSIGQYSRRLRLIGCFKRHMELLWLENHSLKVIHDALVNFFDFYAPSEKFVQDTLQEGRRKLEKDMKEVLLLASWKDTNIDALRESAKRSHHKLFKIIRKYRAVLAQPADGLIGGKISENMTLSGKFVEFSASQHLLLDNEALEVSKQYIPCWDLKPARFADPLSTGEKIRTMSQLPPNILGRAFYLQDFADDLVRAIEVLRDETPSKLTKENGQLTKHLKTRKKRLYAETLRGIRHMGFQSNLGSSILNKQASWAGILGMCPSIPPVAAGISFPEADFHRLLRLIPRARETLRSHSPDLNTRDISQSVGYLESVMFVIIKQRSQLIDRLSELNHLDEIISMIRNLWAPGKYTVQRDNGCHANAGKDNEKVIKWLPGILGAGCILIQKHVELTGLGSSAIVEALKGWQNRLEDLADDYDTVPNLPLNISSSMHESINCRAKDSLSEFKAYLKDAMRDSPALNFILRQIELWTEIDESGSDAQTKDELSKDLVDFDIMVYNACDSILVAMQHTQKIISRFHNSEFDRGWLPLMDSLYFDCLGAFQSRKISNVLNAALYKTSDVATYDGNGLVALGALWASAMPIIQQYRDSLRGIIGHYANFHQALCRLASLLGDAFCRIASQGFCDPAEDSAAAAGDSEKLEEGVGLGDGEGEKDISKDIQDDEDLTELAQGGHGDTESDFSEQEDAVNMDQDELEGETDDANDKDENQDDGDSGEEMDIDDETGQVDDLDPSAVDEKLWDGNAKDKAKEKEGDKETGEISKNEQMAAKNDAKNGAEHAQPDEEIGINESDDENNDQIEHGEAESLDPHLQEEQNLDLPEELDFNDEDNLSTVSGSDFSSDEDDSVADKNNSQDSETDDNINDALSSEGNANKEDMPQSPEEIGKEDNVNEPEQAGSPVDTEPKENDGDLEQGLLRDSPMDTGTDLNNDSSIKSQRYAEDDNQGAEDEQNQDELAQENEGGKSGSSIIDKRVPEFGQLGQAEEKSTRGDGEEERSKEESGNPAFKKLGDALEKWHKRQREIQNSKREQDAAHDDINDVDMTGQEFEHMNDEQEVADTQALGAATNDQAHALDEQALKSQMQDQSAELIPEEIENGGLAGEDQEMKDLESLAPKNEQHQDLSRSGAVIVENLIRDHPLSKDSTATLETPEADIDKLDADLSTTHLQPAYQLSQRTFLEASRLWTHYESLTHSLSLSLTEQLRLILAPTLATKMRGDFRTGKRLNIKRIIPYIASNYKRDKIWMRRSVPSKRAYQILLAVDDSKSMSDSQGGHLALETLALVAKSLSMLEAGEICIVGFGTDVHIAHPFDRPFSAEAGPATIQQFNFQQPHTNVKKLMQASLTLFHDARQKSVRSGATDLWQLQLIISDGVCEDHDAIRRLVRRAQEERIVIVFVMMNAGKGDSILDMSQAIFELDPAGHDGFGMLGAGGAAAGTAKLRIKRYLDGFPFPYYLVVGDVKELPGALATALRQWFAEVVESG